jgi:hypothetical protein
VSDPRDEPGPRGARPFARVRLALLVGAVVFAAILGGYGSGGAKMEGGIEALLGHPRNAAAWWILAASPWVAGLIVFGWSRRRRWSLTRTALTTAAVVALLGLAGIVATIACAVSGLESNGSPVDPPPPCARRRSACARSFFRQVPSGVNPPVRTRLA